MDLKSICMSKICLNLYFNYQLCKKNSFKVPSAVGQQIFEFSFNVFVQFEDNDLKFFKREITELRRINLKRQQFGRIKFFDFLNGHVLDELSFGVIEKFYVPNNKFRVKVNKVIISNLGGKYNNSWKLLNYLVVVNSIVIRDTEAEFENFNSVINLLNNSEKTLLSLHLDMKNLPIKVLKEINDILMKKNDLEKFATNLPIENFEFEKYDFDIELICRNITKLDLNFKNLSIESVELIGKIPRLNSIKISTFLKDNKITDAFLNTLNEQLCLKIENLYLTFKEITIELSEKINDSLANCITLKNIQIKSVDRNNHLNSKIFISLLPSAPFLKTIYLSFKDPVNVDNAVENFLLECSSLIRFEINLYLAFAIDVKFINHALNSSKETIEIFRISYWRLMNDQVKNFIIPKMINVKEINIEAIVFEDNNTMKYLLRSLINSTKYLKSFSLIKCKLHDLNIIDFGKFLNSCQSLQNISICYDESIGKYLYFIISNLVSASSTLRTMNFYRSGINDEQLVSVLPLLKEFKTVRSLNLNGNSITEISILPLTKNLKPFNWKLKILGILDCNSSELLKEYLKLYGLSNPFLKMF